MSKTVGLIGATIWGNRGAEAMLVTAIGRVRRFLPDAEFIIFSYSPQRDSALVNDSLVKVVNSHPIALITNHFLSAFLLKLGLPSSKAARDIRRCDVLLDVSGLSFIAGREKTLPFNVLNMWPARILGVPVVRLSQATGPFTGVINRFAAKFFLPRCKHIFARGSKSATFLTALGLPQDKWTPAADITFLYEQAFSLSDENRDKVAALVTELQAVQQSGKLVIGISPSSLVYQKCEAQGVDYLGLFIRIIETLSDEYHVVVLPNATREGRDTPYNNDLYVINLLRERASNLRPDVNARLHWVDYDINTAGSRDLLAQCTLVLTSRFHCMISSLCLHKPLIVVGWSHKYAEVMADFDLEQYVVDYADDSVDLSAIVSNVLASQDEIIAKIEGNLERVQASSAQQFAYVECILL